MSLSKHSDKFFLNTINFLSLISGIIVFMIAGFLLLESWPALSESPLKFFLDPFWDPSTNKFNMVPMMWGSFFVTIGAVTLALPLGFLSALFYEFIAPKPFSGIYRSVIEILAGIPSVIYGFWGIVAVVPILYHLSPPGANILAGAIVLAVMVMPTMTLFIANALRSAPISWIDGSRALGLSAPTIIFRVLIPGIRQQIFSGVLISIGRAIGETMAVLMVCGNIVKVPLSIFDPVRTLTSNIALEMAYAMNNHRSALFVSGLLLLAIVTGLTILASRFDGDQSHA